MVTNFLNSGLRASKKIGGMTTVVDGLISSYNTGEILAINLLNDSVSS